MRHFSRWLIVEPVLYMPVFDSTNGCSFPVDSLPRRIKFPVLKLRQSPGNARLKGKSQQTASMSRAGLSGISLYLEEKTETGLVRLPPPPVNLKYSL